MSRAEVRQLQRDLQRLGHAEVEPDGADGPLTRAAIRAEERACGWPETGRAGARIAAVLAGRPTGDATPPSSSAACPKPS